jgi:hypothetical protein
MATAIYFRHPGSATDLGAASFQQADTLLTAAHVRGAALT